MSQESQESREKFEERAAKDLGVWFMDEVRLDDCPKEVIFRALVAAYEREQAAIEEGRRMGLEEALEVAGQHRCRNVASSQILVDKIRALIPKPEK